jgi:Pyridoxamine 5'-phosphate oxidase
MRKGKPMDYPEIVHLLNTDPVVQTLLKLPIPMRLAYVGLDGHPRAVPITHLWDGRAFVFVTPATTYKVKAMAAHPEVAFTLDVGPGRTAAEARVKVSAVLGLPVVDYGPLAMIGRGRASIEVKPGLPQEHIDAARRMLADEEKLQEWARVEREHQTEMAVISIIPTHVTVCDFVTRFPPPAALNTLAYGGG